MMDCRRVVWWCDDVCRDSTSYRRAYRVVWLGGTLNVVGGPRRQRYPFRLITTQTPTADRRQQALIRTNKKRVSNYVPMPVTAAVTVMHCGKAQPCRSVSVWRRSRMIYEGTGHSYLIQLSRHYNATFKCCLTCAAACCYNLFTDGCIAYNLGKNLWRIFTR